MGNADLTDLVHVFDDQMLSGAATTYQITITRYNDISANMHMLHGRCPQAVARHALTVRRRTFPRVC